MRSTCQGCIRSSEQRAVQSCSTSPFLSESIIEDIARKASVSWESRIALLWAPFFLMLYCFKLNIKQIKHQIIWNVKCSESCGQPYKPPHAGHHRMMPSLCDAWRARSCLNSVGRPGWKRKSYLVVSHCSCPLEWFLKRCRTFSYTPPREDIQSSHYRRDSRSNLACSKDDRSS